MHLSKNNTIYSVVTYNPTLKKEWDDFVACAKNATFLFYRDFMEYHADRFEDFSLMIFENKKLLAVLPANRVANEFYSHQGLTYGGIILPKGINSIKVFQIIESILEFLKTQGFSKVTIKQVPDFYVTEPTFELPYLFHLKKGCLVVRDMVLAIDYSNPIGIHKTKQKHYKKSKSYDFEIKEDDSLTKFWFEVLEPRLKDKHNVSPVHSISEIQKLKQRFPENIVQYNIYKAEKILAGITVFNKGRVVKSQYGATTDEGEKYRALDYLFLFLIEKYKSEGKRYFSMGTVTDKSKDGYNVGLLTQKQELGCQVYLQDYLRLDLR